MRADVISQILCQHTTFLGHITAVTFESCQRVPSHDPAVFPSIALFKDQSAGGKNGVRARHCRHRRVVSVSAARSGAPRTRRRHRTAPRLARACYSAHKNKLLCERAPGIRQSAWSCRSCSRPSRRAVFCCGTRPGPALSVRDGVELSGVRYPGLERERGNSRTDSERRNELQIQLLCVSCRAFLIDNLGKAGLSVWHSWEREKSGKSHRTVCRVLVGTGRLTSYHKVSTV